MFHSTNDSSNYPGNKSVLLTPQALFPEIDSISLMAQAASENMHSNKLMTQALGLDQRQVIHLEMLPNDGNFEDHVTICCENIL